MDRNKIISIKRKRNARLRKQAGGANILIRGLGLASVWLPAGILLAYAAGFFVLAVWRFRAGEER